MQEPGPALGKLSGQQCCALSSGWRAALSNPTCLAALPHPRGPQGGQPGSIFPPFILQEALSLVPGLALGLAICGSSGDRPCGRLEAGKAWAWLPEPRWPATCSLPGMAPQGQAQKAISPGNGRLQPPPWAQLGIPCQL